MTPPTVDSIVVTTDAADASKVAAGEHIITTVTLSEPVQVTTAPSLALQIGWATKTLTAPTYRNLADDADADNASAQVRKMVFIYTIDARDNGKVSVFKGALSAAITDAANNTTTCRQASTGASTTDRESITATIDPSTGITVATPPTVSGMTLSSTGGVGVGGHIVATVTLSEPVEVAANPRLTLQLGGVAKTLATPTYRYATDWLQATRAI